MKRSIRRYAKRNFKKWLSSALSMALVSSSALGQQTIQVRLDKATNIRKMTKDMLVVETVLPAGTVIEVPIEAYKKAESLPYWQGDAAAQLQFVKGVKVIQAPGVDQQSLEDLAKWQEAEGLFMAKSQLADSFVVETPLVATITLRRPTPVLRNDGPSPTTQPAAQTAPPVENASDELDPTETNKIVDQIQHTNNTVKNTGRTQTTCPACDNDMFQKWVRAGVPARPLQLALEKFKQNPNGVIKNQRFMSIVDFTQRSNQKRMFILDMQTGEVSKYYTTHSRNSETSLGKATRFGNTNGSHLTPPGFHVTQQGFHYGNHGKSIVLHGIENRNSNSAARAILIHKADYARESFVHANGYAGRSWGCDVIDPGKIDEVMDKLKNGALVYHYTGD